MSDACCLLQLPACSAAVLQTQLVANNQVACNASLAACRMPNMRRYAVVPTPLSRLSFWRLVLDEAQLAGGTGKAAEMAQHVRAQHRWAITGDCMMMMHSSLLSAGDLRRWADVHGTAPQHLLHPMYV